MSSRFVAVAFAVGGRNMKHFFTQPALVLPGLLFPLFFFTAFAGGMSAIANVPGFDYPDGYTTFRLGGTQVVLSASPARSVRAPGPAGPPGWEDTSLYRFNAPASPVDATGDGTSPFRLQANVLISRHEKRVGIRRSGSSR